MVKIQHCKQCGRKIFFDGICVACQTENERERILAMPKEELAAAVQSICREIMETGDLEEHWGLFKNLLGYRDIDTTELAKAAFQKGLFYPSELYKDAPDDITAKMLKMVMEDGTDPMLAGKLLLCLAVHGGEDVFQAFLELERHPRKWREKLYANPSVYATYGGWSYDKDGNCLETNFKECYPMVKGTLEEKKKSPVKIGVKTGETCPSCGCALVNLMEIDGSDPRLSFLGISGTAKAKCCPDCLIYSDSTFCRYEVNGESRYFPGEGYSMAEDGPEDQWVEELASNCYVLGKDPVPPRYAADWEGGSSVGGFGFWIQDCEIKLCPDCGKPMKYLAQIQWDTVLDGTEGNAYLEICRDCRIIAFLHQQT